MTAEHGIPSCILPKCTGLFGESIDKSNEFDMIENGLLQAESRSCIIM